MSILSTFIPWQKLILRWDTIKSACSSRALRSSYAFLFIMPLVARALLPLPASVTIPLFGNHFEIALRLPFSWWALFTAACFGSIASSIYSLLCPELLRQYSDYPSYEGAKRGARLLVDTVEELLPSETQSSAMPRKDWLIHRFVVFARQFSKMDNHEHVGRFVAEALEGNASPAFFYFVHDGAKRGRVFWRCVATISLYLAFVCIGWVAIQSVIYVFAYAWAHR